MNELSKIMYDDNFRDESNQVDGRSAYETTKDIAASYNQITYPNFEINSKINNAVNK